MNLAIIQARMGSSRLPGKVLLNIIGKPVLYYVVNRVKESSLIDKIVVATTSNEEDHTIVEFCKNEEVTFYCGSEDDVLDRYYQAAKRFGRVETDTIIRVTSDCPLIDPCVINDVIMLLNRSEADYASNTLIPTYPDGLDVEAFKFSALERAWTEARLSSEREHVTPYIKKHPEIFRLENLLCEKNYSEYRWTLDEAEDYELIKAIYENLYKEKRLFGMMDILHFIEDNAQILELNSHFVRNEGYIKSLKNDHIVT